jgi:hypothetical protein
MNSNIYDKVVLCSIFFLCLLAIDATAGKIRIGNKLKVTTFDGHIYVGKLIVNSTESISLEISLDSIVELDKANIDQAYHRRTHFLSGAALGIVTGLVISIWDYNKDKRRSTLLGERKGGFLSTMAFNAAAGGVIGGLIGVAIVTEESVGFSEPDVGLIINYDIFTNRTNLQFAYRF